MQFLLQKHSPRITLLLHFSSNIFVTPKTITFTLQQSRILSNTCILINCCRRKLHVVSPTLSLFTLSMSLQMQCSNNNKLCSLFFIFYFLSNLYFILFSVWPRQLSRYIVVVIVYFTVLIYSCGSKQDVHFPTQRYPGFAKRSCVVGCDKLG